MTVTDIRDIKEELVVWLRNNITDPSSRMTAGSIVETADGTQTEFITAHADAANITSVTVSGVAQSFGTDYTTDYKNDTMSGSPSITFNTAPTSGVEIQVNYEYGTPWIFPDYPHVNLSLDNYPRMSIDIIASREEPMGIGGTTTISDYMVSIIAFAKRTEVVDDLLQEARSGLIANMKNFYYFDYIQPTGYGPMGRHPERHDKIFSRNLDGIIKFKVDK